MREMKGTMREVMGSIANRRTQPRKLRVGQLVYSPQSGESHLRSSRMAPCSFASRLPSPAMAGELRGCAQCIAVALNFVAFWWHWEARLPDWGMMPSGAETSGARLVLFWAVASLACGAALFDLIRPPIRMRRRIMVLLSAALVLGMMPFLIGHLFLK